MRHNRPIYKLCGFLSAFAAAVGLIAQPTASGKPVLLDYDTKAGHSGGQPLDRISDDFTNSMAFALAQTGVLTVR